MDIKIRFTKKSGLILGGIILCGLIAFGGWYNSAAKARHDIKNTCQINCDCFNNVVDYRLTNERVKLFARFMKEIQTRKNANVLEFMDAMDAVAIQKSNRLKQIKTVIFLLGEGCILCRSGSLSPFCLICNGDNLQSKQSRCQEIQDHRHRQAHEKQSV